MLRSNLKAILDAKGITAHELAEAINYDELDVRDLYDDLMEEYPGKLLNKVCKYLKISLSELLVIED